jgi:hypothetical protein
VLGFAGARLVCGGWVHVLTRRRHRGIRDCVAQFRESSFTCQMLARTCPRLKPHGHNLCHSHCHGGTLTVTITVPVPINSHSHESRPQITVTVMNHVHGHKSRSWSQIALASGCNSNRRVLHGVGEAERSNSSCKHPPFSECVQPYTQSKVIVRPIR